MKITSGEYKYRKIEIPYGIRPTTEKVREAVFSMITAWLPGAEVLDLFAGSGALGLEALSRGAENCCFCEINRQNQKILMENIANCGATERSTVIGKDYKVAISTLAGRSKGFDIVIMDPPYEMTEYYETAMMMLQENSLLNDSCIIIAEHLYNNRLLDSYGNFVRVKEKKYGTIGIDIFQYNI